VFENRVPSNVFEQKREAVTGDWIKIYKTINFPVVFYECDTWFLALREVGWGP
jgi:hypothetical protein